MSFKTHYQYNIMTDQLDIYIFEHRANDIRWLCTDLKRNNWIEIKPFELLPEPTFSFDARMSKPFMQSMTEMLYEQGYRPKKEPVLQNELTAVKDHLADIKTIAFNELGIKEQSDEQQGKA